MPSPKTTQAAFEEITLKPGEVIEITSDMIIGDIVRAFPDTIKIFQKAGIHCVGCYASTFESIVEGCYRHNLDAKKICRELNKALQKAHHKK